MSNLMQANLIVRKETVYAKIRRSLLALIYQKDHQMIQRLDELMIPKRPANNSKIVIPKEIGKNIEKL